MKLNQIINLSEASLNSIKNSWKKLGIDGALTTFKDVITVDKIVVPQDKRNKGLGTQAMKQLISYADKDKKTIALSPTTDFGSKKNKLITFYKKLGFVMNSGKNIDYAISEEMYKLPE